MLLGWRLRLRQLQGQPLADLWHWPFRPVLNTLNLGERWGYRMALLPIFVTCNLALSNVIAPRAGSIFVCWVLSILALALAQTRLEAWATGEMDA